MIIEALLPDARRSGSSRVIVDGKPIWTVPAEVVGRLALGPGSKITGDLMAELEEAANQEGALRSAMRMLERRSHGRTELGRKLSRKGHSDLTVEATLDRLDRLELIDDKVFAVDYVTGRATRGRGPARLRRDLVGLGIAADVVEEAIGTLERSEAPSPWEKTLAQASRRAQSAKSLPRATQVRRLMAFFVRRGFGGEEVRTAVAQLVDAVDQLQ